MPLGTLRKHGSFYQSHFCYASHNIQITSQSEPCTLFTRNGSLSAAASNTWLTYGIHNLRVGTQSGTQFIRNREFQQVSWHKQEHRDTCRTAENRSGSKRINCNFTPQSPITSQICLTKASRPSRSSIHSLETGGFRLLFECSSGTKIQTVCRKRPPTRGKRSNTGDNPP